MGEVAPIFESVLLNLLDSFVPHVDFTFTKLENEFSTNSYNDDEMDEILQKMVLTFPKMMDEYQRTLNIITEFATANPNPEDSKMKKKTEEKVTTILILLCNKFKSEANRSAEKDFTLLRILSPAFRPSNFYHFQFLRCLTLVILSDIIRDIFTRAPNQAAITKVVGCGFHNCVATHRLDIIQSKLVQTWADTIAEVSKISVTEIISSFDQYIDDENSHLVLELVGKIKANDAFVESILLTVQQQKKRKTLSSRTLSTLASLLSVAKCKSDLLREFFNLAWSVRSQDGIKDGAVDLITTLFNRLSDEAKKASSFYSTRVFKHIGNPAKLPRTANAFLRLIQGDISKVSHVSELPELKYISSSGNLIDNTPFATTFMKTFFVKSDFTNNYEVFIRILVQLAACDLKAFNTTVIPQFMKLKCDDIKFTSILHAASFISSKEFEKHAACKPTKDQLSEMNSQIRAAVLSSIGGLEEYIRKEKFVLRISDSITNYFDESDIIVSDFISKKKYTHFEAEQQDFEAKLTFSDDINVATAMLSVIPHALKYSDYSDDKILKCILLLSASSNIRISKLAFSVLNHIFSQQKSTQYIIQGCINYAQLFDNPVLKTHCLTVLYNLFLTYNYEPNDRNILEIQALGLVFLSSNITICRYYALNLLKYIASKSEDQVWSLIELNNEMICEACKLSILVMDAPPKPVITAPPRGNISWENVCCSRYNTLWYLFYGEIINILIEYHIDSIFDLIRDKLYPKYKSIIQGNVDDELKAINILVMFFNTFARDPDLEPVQFRDKTVDHFFNESLKAPKDSAKIVIKAMKHFNWRVLIGNLLYIRNFPPELITLTASTMAFIIQMPNNFSHILTACFRPFIEFLSMLQTHFASNGVNGPRQIIWDDAHIKLLKKHEDTAVNYCIIIAAVFNNILDQIPEEEWPVATRQIIVQFLYHWCQLEDKENKVRCYSVNALIPIMKAGQIFTDGFEFELPMLEIMAECQIAGYDVLSSVLLYHFDLMFDIFVRQIFIRPRRESSLFFEAVLSSFDVCAEAQLMQAHVGSLLLLTQFWGRDNPEPAKPILVTIADLFIDQATNSDVQNIIQNAKNLDFVPVMFNFAAEQVIEAGFEIMKSTKLVTTVKNIVAILVMWFSQIRVLPTNKHIIQGIPSKFRRFNVISFLRAMSDVSKYINEEQHEVFSQLWYELLKIADNSIVVLLCIFEFEDMAIKERIFSQQLERNPQLITKYLAKRCSFSFWYFLQTEQNQNINSIMWILPVLTRAFTDYVGTEDLVELHYTTVIHFTLLFIEKSYNFFEDLISVFEPEFADSVLQLTPDLEGGAINVGEVASKIAEGLHEIAPAANQQWSQEAFKWGVCCNDIKAATRSLVVFNALRGEFLPTYAPILIDAAAYHVSHCKPEDSKDLANFIGECFGILYNNIDNPEITPIAFNFASECLHFKEIGDQFLKRAMPIFKYCAFDTAMAASAKELLIEAFTPFAPVLECEAEAQELLKDIADLNSAPEALLIAAPFIKHSLPFVDFGYTYEGIMATPFDSLHCTVVLKFFIEMLRNAGQPLVDAILDVSTELARRFGDCIPAAILNQVYVVALTKVSQFRSAINFIMLITALDPSIATATQSVESENGHTFAELAKKISALVSDNRDQCAITSCSQIPQLRGIISQENPPKITPFSTQHEMFVGLKRAEDTTGSSRTRIKRMSSSCSIARGLLFANSKTTVLNMMQATPTIQVKELPTPIVKQELFQRQEATASDFLLSIEAFAQLGG